MLTRRVHIRVRQRRIGTLTQRIPPCSLPHPNLSPGQGSRHFSLSTITDPINNAVATLPLQIQYTIPETILNLSEAYVPAGLPTYTTGIVVFAFLTRLAFFTPWSLWARQRKWRNQELVRPQALAEAIWGWQAPLRDKLTAAGVPPAEQKAIVAANINFRGAELAKQYKCTRGPTMFMPILFTLPAFIAGSSIMYATASLPALANNPALTEMFLVPNATPLIPLGLAALSLVSVDIGTLSPKTAQMMGKINTKDAEIAKKKLEKGLDKPTQKVLDAPVGPLVQTTFRVLGLGRALLCVALPGTINIFWFTSSAIGVIESLIFTYIERRRAPRHWGRNSRLLLLPREQLKERGFNFSRIPPLERAGKADYTRTNSPNRRKNHSKIERLATNTLLGGLNAATAASEKAVTIASNTKSRTLSSIAWSHEKTRDVVTSTGDAVRGVTGYIGSKYHRIKNLDIKDVKKWINEFTERWEGWRTRKIDALEIWLERSGRRHRRARNSVRMSLEEWARRKRKQRQWLFVLGKINKEKAREARRIARERAEAEKAANNIPGLQSPRPQQPRKQGMPSSKPLIN